MNLVFIQGGSRWKFDDAGNMYTDANFNEHIWDRYRSYCDELTVILKKDSTMYSVKEAKRRFNVFDTQKSKYVALPDIYRPITRFFSPPERREINEKIEKEIKRADAVVIRSIGTYYTNTALKMVRKYSKPYLVEETGFSFESLWYHSLPGKLASIPNEITTRRLMKDVPWAIYVTNEALQRRYPCKGRSIGCSDVEISISENVLYNRIHRQAGDKVVFGTAAFLDVGWKGQRYVIEAVAKLKKAGITNIEYQLIGAGTGDSLQKLAKELGVEDQVNILGALPHNQVFEWMDHLDVYVQTSFMEGLCRSIIEAMSRGCPVICTDVGGNYELVEKECLMKAGNVSDIENRMRLMLKEENRAKYSAINFTRVKDFDRKVLNQKRDDFYHEFIASVTG